MSGVRMRWKMLPERRRGIIGRYVEVSTHLSSAPALFFSWIKGKCSDSYLSDAAVTAVPAVFHGLWQ